MERPWMWRSEEADVRYGFYRIVELLEETRARTRPPLARDIADEPPARPLVAAATAARWELHGLVAALDAGELDADPGNEQWTVRQTLAHIVNGQRAYGWFTAWWVAQRHVAPADYPRQVPDDLAGMLPEEELEGRGALDDIIGRLDTILDQSASVFAGLGHDELALPARWSGIEVTVGFRLGRWSSHIREHTVQLHKTLAILGRRRTEGAHLVAAIAAAYGRLEEELYAWPAGRAGVADALELAQRALAEAGEHAAAVRAAARHPSGA